MPRFVRSLFAVFMVLAGLWPVPSPAQSVSKPIRLALITPQAADTPYWKSFTEFAAAAARDLGVVFEAHHAEFKRDRYLALFKQLATRQKNRPHAVIVKNERGLGLEMLRIAEKANMPVFFVNTGLRDKEIAAYGGPRKRFKRWLGEVLPDNEKAGYYVAKNLIRMGLKAERLKGKRLSMVALGGASTDGASLGRLRGLKRGVAEFAQVGLVGIRSGGWIRTEARLRTAQLLAAYPELNLVWAANDDMALGAIDALRDVKRKPGRDVLVAGLNWRPEALATVKSGAMAFTLGGHFMDGAWAVVMLNDYFKGRDFADFGVSFRTNWGVISAANVERLSPLVGDEDWDRIDFRRFSRVTNPKLKAYDFSLKTLLSAF